MILFVTLLQIVLLSGFWGLPGPSNNGEWRKSCRRIADRGGGRGGRRHKRVDQVRSWPGCWWDIFIAISWNLSSLWGETSSEGPDRDSLNSASSSGGRQREEENDYQVDGGDEEDEDGGEAVEDDGDSDDQDDVDDEITAVFAENGAGDDGMSKSWHGSRSARWPMLKSLELTLTIFFSQKSLSFFVDINGAESPGPPPLTRFLFFHCVILDIATARFLSWTLQFPIKWQFDWNQVASNITIFDLPIFRVIVFIALGYQFSGKWQSPSHSRLNPKSISFLIEDNSICFLVLPPYHLFGQIWLLFLVSLSSSIQSRWSIVWTNCLAPHVL